MDVEQAGASKAQRTKATLRHAARAAFAEHGWAGTRVKDITAVAQVSHGTFYTYYENREAILDELIADVIKPLLDLAAAPWRAQTPTEGLRSIIEAFLDVHQGGADIIVVWRQAAADQPRYEQSWASVHEAFTNRIIQRFEGLARVVGTTCTPEALQDVASTLVSMAANNSGYTIPVEQTRTRMADTMMVIWGGAINHLLGANVIDRPAGL